MRIQTFLLFFIVITSSALFAEETTKKKVQVEPDQSPILVEEDKGVFVVATSRESQPMFNEMDILVSYNNIPIQSKAHLKSLLENQFHESTHSLEIIRDKKLITIEVAAGPWHVDLHDMTQEAYATLITDQNGKPLSDRERKQQMGMLKQYLKGRPYRTPNNQGSEIDQKTERHSDGKDKEN